MSRRGRSRPASSNDEKSERTDEESPSSSIPLVFEYESEDGARISIDPGGIELSREYEVSEDLNVEISYEVDWGIGDVDVKRKGLDLDDLEISGEIGLPGDLLGFGGGVTLDLSTGEISGGEVSVEAGGVEIELSVTENGCKVGLSVSILGIGVGVTKDICEDEEEEEEEEDNKKPSSNDRLTQESVEDIMKRWREKGDENICGDIPLHLHTTWHGPDTPVSYAWKNYALRFSRGGIWDDYARDAEENEMMIGWVWDLFLGTHPDERLIVAKGFEPQFDACMNKLYEDSTTKIKKIIPPSPPPMRNKQNCCTESTKLLLELHKVFRVKEVLEKGFPLPTNQVSPGGKGKLINKDYATIIKRLFQAINMRTVQPFTAKVADAHPNTPGDQPLTKTYPEATSAMQEVVELLLKNQIDDQTTLNFLIRQSILQGELMLVLQECRSTLHTLLYGSGIPFKEGVGKVRIPFDLDPVPDEKKSKQEKALDINQNDAVKKLLPEFLRSAEETYDAFMYDDSAETMWYYVTMAYMKTKGFK